MVELKKQNYKKNKSLYNKIEKELRKSLDKSIPIDQVGSTVIPNMYGKNIIDIVIGAKDDDEFENIKKILEKMNYAGRKKSQDSIYQFFASTEEETGSGDVHIHLVIKETERYLEFLILKQYLLDNALEAKKYLDFKKEIIKKGIEDRREYKRVKSEYVSSLLERAKKAVKKV